MEQFMQRSLKRTRTAEELYDLEDQDHVKRHKTDIITAPMLVPTFSSTHHGSLPTPEEFIHDLEPQSTITTTTTTTTNHYIDQSLLKPFTISTKKNNEYNEINDLLYQVHVMRYGDPELRERWWEGQVEQQQQQQVKQVYSMGGYNRSDMPMYESANATLRQAFLQRHHHHH
ncbi:hypothetical protein BDA99DRAFT_558244 [Phascolomyces articulosus]|uniref:Uncharacterized protein n=1 Tax=Phascolomyces articulosus TaxID=60185 RepID=A0AAD5K3W6_9FUNG|nr:hypothetical protein BDA99DRAFT_558244 [Phascolomyces articulosus]